MAGTKKLASLEDTAEWFGDPDWGLGMPFPEPMAFFAASTETRGAMLLLMGLGMRSVSIPLMVTMMAAAVTVHWQNGWLAIAEGPGSLFVIGAGRYLSLDYWLARRLDV
jgi:uncharacterized membrane protein YphA (DoxX/SURF4 family)